MRWAVHTLFCALLIMAMFPINHAIGQDNGTGQDAAPAKKDTRVLTRLPNGLLVYLVRDARFPLVCCRLYVGTGSANEPARLAGISHVLEHMVFKGTSHRPKGQVAKEVESLGGYINAATSFDKTWYLADMPAEHWREGVDVIKDMAFQATLDPAELDSEKEVVISELKRGEDSPARKLFESLQVAALKNTPYGRPIIGFEDTIRAITVDDLKAYIAKWYQPQNMMLLVAGDIDVDAVLAYAQETFGSLKNSSDLPVLAPVDLADASAGSPIVEVVRGPWSKVYLGLAMPAPDMKSMRSMELDALCYLLGGDGTSLLEQKYTYDSQLADSIDAGNMSLARAGMLSITAVAQPEKVAELWDSLTKDLAGLSGDSFKLDAISRAKFNIATAMDRAGETLNGLTSWLGSIEFDLGGAQVERNLRFTLNNVNPAQLQNAIASWLRPERARIRVFAPEGVELPDFEAVFKRNWPMKAAAEKMEQTQASAGAMEILDIGEKCRLILIPDNNAPYISLDFMMDGGNALLKPDQQGLASLTARLLRDGCGSMHKPVLERWLAERAADVAARANMQTFGISLSGPSKFNADYFGLLLDILRKPKFDPGDFKREVEEMKAAIKQRNDAPVSYMFSKIGPFLFPGGQIYGYDSLGSDESLDKFNVGDARDFWARQSGQPWVLAIAGSFDREQVITFAKSLPAPRSDAPEIAPPAWDEEKKLNLALPGRQQAHLAWIFKTVPYDNPDTAALELLQAVLAGQSGMLFTKLRDEEGLGYTVTAFNRSMPKAGYLAFYIGTTADKVEEAKKGFTNISEFLKKDLLPAEELKAAANKLLGDYLRGRQSLGSRAGDAATNAILKYPPDIQKRIIDAAAALSPEDLRETAKKYLESPYEVTLLP